MKMAWTKLALQDINHAWNYIAMDNPAAADRMIERISKAVDGLFSYQKLGRPGRVNKTRELVVIGTPYIVPYRIKQDTIEVLAVIHSSRRWPANL